MEQKNIFQSIVAVINDLDAIEKSKKNQAQGFMYRGIDDVMNNLKPLFAKHKIFAVPTVLSETYEERQTARGGAMISSKLKMQYRFYAEDGSYIDAVTMGEAMDSGDKASNKSMAIAFKYALFQVFCIPTEEIEDPDEEMPPQTTKTIKLPTVETEQKMAELGITRDKVALWKKKPADQVSDEDCLAAIAIKERNIAKVKKKEEETNE